MIKKTKVAVFYREINPQLEAENRIKELCESKGFIYDKKEPDVVIHIGGDGTFLRAVHHYSERVDEISFIGLKAGTLGFFYDFDLDNLEEIMDMIANKTYREDKYFLLEGSMSFANGDIKSVYAVNEIRIESPFKTLICDVFINDEHLEKFRGNGLNVCSALGSSGYNKSLGGALVEHGFDILQLTEIAAINNSVYHSIGSPLVLSRDNFITFKGDFSTMRLGFDYQSFDLTGVQELVIRVSNKPIRVLRSKDHSYIRNVKRSLIK